MEQKELEKKILAIVGKKPMSRASLINALKGEASDNRVLTAVSVMLRSGALHQSELTANGVLLGVKRFVTLQEEIIGALDKKAMTVSQLKREINRPHTTVTVKLRAMESKGLVTVKSVGGEQVWEVRPQNLDDESTPEGGRTALIKAVAAQWRGTPWQGMECVL